MRSSDGISEAVYLLLGAALGAVFTWGASLASPGAAVPVDSFCDVLSAAGSVVTAVIALRAFLVWRRELDDKIAHEAQTAVALLCDGLRGVRDALERAGELAHPGITSDKYLDELTTLLATPERSNQLRDVIAAARVRFGKPVDTLMRRVVLLDNGTFNKLGALKSLGSIPSAGPKDYARAIEPLSRLSDDADKLENELRELFASLIGKPR